MTPASTALACPTTRCAARASAPTISPPTSSAAISAPASNLIGNYFANRAELGISHFGTFENDFASSTEQRTSLRFASSLAFADGACLDRPPDLRQLRLAPAATAASTGAAVLIDPTPSAIPPRPACSAPRPSPASAPMPSARSTVDAPDAPAGVDLGQGSFRLFPPYSSGYRLEVGSDYNVTALGRLLNGDRRADLAAHRHRGRARASRAPAGRPLHQPRRPLRRGRTGARASGAST